MDSENFSVEWWQRKVYEGMRRESLPTNPVKEIMLRLLTEYRQTTGKSDKCMSDFTQAARQEYARKSMTAQNEPLDFKILSLDLVSLNNEQLKTKYGKNWNALIFEHSLELRRVESSVGDC